jgi:hypothetical protein
MSKICIASIYTPNLAPLNAITWGGNKAEYCKRHGYEGRCKLQTTKYTGFDKILYLDSLIQQNKYDWIGWFDCDTLITNFDIKVEDLFANDTAHFFLNTDVNDINAGVFFFRTTTEGLSYFNYIKSAMYTFASENKYHLGEEQTAMIKTHNDPAFKDIVKIVPQRTFNSYNYDYYNYNRSRSIDKLGTQGQWSPGDFVIHIPGFGVDRFEENLGHFRKYIELVVK